MKQMQNTLEEQHNPSGLETPPSPPGEAKRRHRGEGYLGFLPQAAATLTWTRISVGGQMDENKRRWLWRSAPKSTFYTPISYLSSKSLRFTSGHTASYSWAVCWFTSVCKTLVWFALVLPLHSLVAPRCGLTVDLCCVFSKALSLKLYENFSHLTFWNAASKMLPTAFFKWRNTRNNNVPAVLYFAYRIAAISQSRTCTSWLQSSQWYSSSKSIELLFKLLLIHSWKT